MKSAIIFAVFISTVSAIIIQNCNCNQFICILTCYFFLLQLNFCQSLSKFFEKEEDHGQLLDQALLKIREIENVQDISMEEHEENQFRIKEMSMQIIKAVINRRFYGIPRDPNYWTEFLSEEMQFDEDAIEEKS